MQAKDEVILPAASSTLNMYFFADGPIDEPAPKGGHQQTRDDNVEKRPKMTSSDGQLLRCSSLKNCLSQQGMIDVSDLKSLFLRTMYC